MQAAICPHGQDPADITPSVSMTRKEDFKCFVSINAVQVTSLFSGYVSALLAEHASSPAQNWKAKDCAMYLVVALAVRGRTAAAGVTSTNQLVNIQDFFNQQVGCWPPPMKCCLNIAIPLSMDQCSDEGRMESVGATYDSRM